MLPFFNSIVTVSWLSFIRNLHNTPILKFEIINSWLPELVQLPTDRFEDENIDVFMIMFEEFKTVQGPYAHNACASECKILEFEGCNEREKERRLRIEPQSEKAKNRSKGTIRYDLPRSQAISTITLSTLAIVLLN